MSPETPPQPKSPLHPLDLLGHDSPQVLRRDAARLLAAGCEQKHTRIGAVLPCRREGAAAKVDLVVVIDTSDSLSSLAEALSKAAEATVDRARTQQPSDLRSCWFGVEGTWDGTKFNTSYRQYLEPKLGDSAQQLAIDADTGASVQAKQEDGAAAVIDLSRHFDWRPGAQRTILYIGDEALNGDGFECTESARQARREAVEVARRQRVTVHTYLAPSQGTPAAGIADNYAALARDTGGTPFTGGPDELEQFQPLFLEILAMGPGRPVAHPSLAPRFALSWSDGLQDRMETDDVESMCLSVGNPYAGVTFKQLSVQVVVSDAQGQPVPPLPDGTPSVIVKPGFEIHFGDIPPSDPEASESCISRELVLIARGARPGGYRLNLVYTFGVAYEVLGSHALPIELVRS